MQTRVGCGLVARRKAVATANESGVVQMWDTATGQATFALRGHEGRVVSVAWSADGRHLLSGSRDATAYIWKATSGQRLSLWTIEWNNIGCGLDARWRRILTGGGTWLELGVMDGVVREWDVETGKQLRALDPSKMLYTRLPCPLTASIS